MDRMVRKQVYIEPHQEALLKRLAKELEVSEAELIRQAIDHQASALSVPRRDLSAWQEERAFIHRCIGQGPLPGGRTWRREDLHER